MPRLRDLTVVVRGVEYVTLEDAEAAVAAASPAPSPALAPDPDAHEQARYRRTDEATPGWDTDEGWDLRRDLFRARQS